MRNLWPGVAPRSSCARAAAAAPRRTIDQQCYGLMRGPSASLSTQHLSEQPAHVLAVVQFVKAEAQRKEWMVREQIRDFLTYV